MGAIAVCILGPPDGYRRETLRATRWVVRFPIRKPMKWPIWPKVCTLRSKDGFEPNIPNFCRGLCKAGRTNDATASALDSGVAVGGGDWSGVHARRGQPQR